ncbi:hypothetical protein [Ursidibacter sp. B-7004-1]
MRNQFPTPEQNHSLLNSVYGGSIESTITIEGKHYPNSSAFFISQIPFNGLLTLFKSEFAKWSIRRNKASNRTNKASRSIAVVEPISHPIQQEQGGNSLQTKQLRTTKMNPIQHTAHNANKTPIVFISHVMGVVYA